VELGLPHPRIFRSPFPGYTYNPSTAYAVDRPMFRLQPDHWHQCSWCWWWCCCWCRRSRWLTKIEMASSDPTTWQQSTTK